MQLAQETGSCNCSMIDGLSLLPSLAPQAFCCTGMLMDAAVYLPHSLLLPLPTLQDWLSGVWHCADL